MSAIVAIVCATFLVACDASDADAIQSGRQQSSSGEVAPTPELPEYAPAPLKEATPVSRAEEDSMFDQAARAAWALIERSYYPATGFASAQPTFPYPTAWDIASTLAAYYSARGLGYLSEDEYRRRAGKLLQTLKTVRLFEGVAYGRNYDARNGELVGATQKPDPNGTGYSAIDLGRMLVVLAVVAKQDPQLADAARAVATRIDAARVIRDGFMWGSERNSKTNKQENYQEGRIGYEQYAAAGFNLWNMNANAAANARASMTQSTVLGIPIAGDKRGLDRLTSEPFILHGLELGWDPTMREIALQTLSAQAARYVQTGQITIASEDAINRAPYYFYYFCVYCSGKAFSVNVHSPTIMLTEPRWISTKGAFGWYALVPSKYTWQALQAVKPAFNPQRGWASGVFEDSKKSTATYSLNTAATILEAALYRKTGKPLIAASR
jgi:hypothetical protein